MTKPAVPIGEVLAQLKDEFPDVSVSKIRFLESEGLIAPERTASGYRKFAEADIEQLRTVLRLQRDSFLPLRIIRDRLAAGESAADIAPGTGASPAHPYQQDTAEAPVSRAPEPIRKDDPLEAPEAANLTLTDLAATAGISVPEAEALREFGVICPHGSDGLVTFDGTDLIVAKLAREFLVRGIEARHLKTLRRIAEQEAQLFSQLIAPAMRNRKAEVRDEAAVQLTEVARLARDLRQAYVGQTLRAALNGDV